MTAGTIRSWWIWAALVAVLAATVGFAPVGSGAATPVAGTPTTGTPGGGGIAHPTGADEAIVRVEEAGGFVPVEFLLTATPRYALYGDGLLVAQGPTTLEFPGPALPNLRRVRLSEAGIQAVLEAAEAAGLLGGDAEYAGPPVADAGTTVVTVAAGGRTSTVSAYALGLEDGVPGGEAAPRAALLGFLEVLADPSRLPAGSVVEENEAYEVERVQVVVRPLGTGETVEGGEAAWPLDGDLGAFGEPYVGPGAPAGDPLEARCGVVEGEEAQTLIAALERANALTVWESAGETWRVFPRPLLPDEAGCPAGVADGTPEA